MSITTPLKKLIRWPAKATSVLAKIRPAIKNIDLGEKALDTKESVLRARRKTIALFRRPLNDISHIGIIVVVSVALLTGVSAMFGTTDQVAVNPFVAEKATAQQYVSEAKKRITEADQVTTLAYIYSDNLGADAVKITENIYKGVSTASTSQYIASVSIVQTTSATATGNTPTEYMVQDGDTLSTIAVKYNITTDTIRYANGITDIDSLKPGQKLTILPVTGVYYTVKDGDTTASIANKYQIDEQMVISQNDLYGEDLKAGMKLMLADAAIPELPKPVVQPQSGGSSGSSSYSGPVYAVSTSSGPNHFPWGWCTWYVASRRYVPWSGDAHDWYYNAQAYGRPVGKAPVIGAIMVTWESGWGHVAYVESVSGSTFTVSEMNYAGWGRISSRTLTTSQVPLIGFVY